MQTIRLNNGVAMPMVGFGVFQMAPEVCERAVAEVAARHGRSAAQVSLRWNLQRGVPVIPKSTHRARMAENLAVWDFALDEGEMAHLAALDKGRPRLFDPRSPAEVRRIYGYLDNPVLTTLR